MAKSRKELMAYASRKHVDVDGVRLQSLSELEKAKLDALWGERYNATKQVDMVMRRELVVACIVDDDGNRLFLDSEVDLLGEWDAGIIGQLYEACRKLCGFDDREDLEEAAKKSDRAAESN